MTGAIVAVGIIFTLLMPGFIFQKALLRTENTQIERRPFTVMSTQALGLAIIINSLGICFVKYLTPLTVDYSIWLKVILNKSLPLVPDEIAIIENSIPYVASYIVAIFLFSRILGFLVQKLWFWLFPYKDSKFSFDTPWYYELKGKLSKDSDAEFIVASFVQDIGNTAYIYRGILQDFYLNKDGYLDRIVISNCYKRAFENISSDQFCNEELPFLEQMGFVLLNADRYVFKYSEIKNLSLEYQKMVKQEETESDLSQST